VAASLAPPKTPGSGRVKGKPPQVTENMRAVLREVLGLENIVIRKRLQRWFETGDAGGLDHGAGLGSATFRHILLMGHGQVKHTMESGDAKRQSLYFVTTSGLYPWQMDNMKEQTDAMLAQGKAEERLQLEAAKKPAEPIEAAADKDSEVPETLELVEPQPSPDDFNTGRGGRH
jgi:hypothetical protein